MALLERNTEAMPAGDGKMKDAKHVFVFFQQTCRQDSLTQNPYDFDTFDMVEGSRQRTELHDLRHYPEQGRDRDQTGPERIGYELKHLVAKIIFSNIRWQLCITRSRLH